MDKNDTQIIQELAKKLVLRFPAANPIAPKVIKDPKNPAPPFQTCDSFARMHSGTCLAGRGLGGSQPKNAENQSTSKGRPKIPTKSN